MEEKLKELVREWEEKIQGIERTFREKLVELEQLFRSFSENKQQLNFPIDVISKRIIRDSVVIPITTKISGTNAATAINYGRFFTADRPYIVVGASEVHGTAGSDGSAVSLQIERLQGTEALGAGDVLLSTAFDLKGTADTVQYGTLTTSGTLLILSRGDRLALKDSGTPTSVADVQVTVFIKQL